MSGVLQSLQKSYLSQFNWPGLWSWLIRNSCSGSRLLPLSGKSQHPSPRGQQQLIIPGPIRNSCSGSRLLPLSGKSQHPSPRGQQQLIIPGPIRNSCSGSRLLPLSGKSQHPSPSGEQQQLILSNQKCHQQMQDLQPALKTSFPA